MSEPLPVSRTDAAALLARLRERGWRVGVAESLTGGAVLSSLVSVPGASSVLRGGIVAYATDLKTSLLGVDADLLAREGPVHPEVALQMAHGIRRVTAERDMPTDVGIATTGVAGPESQGGAPVGRVFVAVVTPEGERVDRLDLVGDRAAVRAGAHEAVLALLAVSL